MLNNLECLHVSSHICVLHLCWHGKASDINVSISAPQCVGAVQMVCRLLISPKSPKFVTTFRAPLREMKMVTRNVRVVVVGWGGWLASWLARCNHGHYLMELEEIGWAESGLLPVMGKMTPLSQLQSIPYSPERPINKTKEGFWAATHPALRRHAARNVKYAQIPTWTR